MIFQPFGFYRQGTSPIIVDMEGIDFDGGGDYISAPFISFSGKETISFWIKTTETVTSRQFQDSSGILKLIYLNNEGGQGNIQVLYRGDDNTFPTELNGRSTDGTINDGDWHHVAIVIDDTLSGTSDTLKMYQDGVALTIEFRYNAGIGTMTGSSLRWMGRTGDRFINGTLAELSVFSDALTQTEVQELADGKQLCGDEPNLERYYRLDEIVSGEVIDLAGSNNGTVNGNPTEVATTIDLTNDC